LFPQRIAMAKLRRITVEDLWKLRRPAQTTLAPDGSQACVSVSSFDMKENKASSMLWLVSTFGGKPRQLTACGEKDGEPKWSPDGKTIAFVAKREEGGKKDEEPQIYLIAPDGGEARRLTDIATGVLGIKWFPDSGKIAFISWVWPDTRGEKAQAKRLKQYKDSKVKAHVVEHAAYRFWDHWLTDGRVPHVFVVDAESGVCRDLFADSKYELLQADICANYYDISPDGKEIAFIFDPAEEKRFDHEHHIVAIDVKSRKFKSLTARSPLNHAGPRYSPDGRWLAMVTQNLRQSPVAQEKLALLERKTGKLSFIADKWDRSVHVPLVWSADAKSIYFTAEDRARTHLFRFAIGRKQPGVVAQGGVVSDFDVASGAAAFVRTDMNSPPGVFAIDTVSVNSTVASAKGAFASVRKLESFNDKLMSQFRLGEVKEFQIKGWNDEAVQMWAIYPPDFDPKKKYPLVHNIHGGPHSNWGDNFHFRWNNQVFAAQGYVVVCVNYHGSSSWGQKFLESIDREWGKRELADIEAGTDFMLKQGYIDSKRLAATGGSYGGYMVAWMNGHPAKGGDRYKAYVCHAGCFDWIGMFSDDAYYWHPKELGAFYWDDMKKVEAQNPRAFAKIMKTPTLVIHGMLDYRVPDAQGLAYYNTLKSKGVPSRLVFFPDENHWILKPQNSQLWYREYFAWLEKYVGKGPTRKK
jgi:dipeptidyl aminopeptidase/acylaminoacyl peptidase